MWHSKHDGNVVFWPIADMAIRRLNVRFRGQNRHLSDYDCSLVQPIICALKN